MDETTQQAAGNAVELPEGVEITTSNTTQITVAQEQQTEGNPAAGQGDSQAADGQVTDEQIEADIQAAQKAEADLKGQLETKGVNFADLEAEFAKDGSLSDASYQALEKAGFSRSVVDAYTTGLTARAEQYVSRVTALAGGEESLKAVQTFLSTPENKAAALAFNEAIEKGSLKQVELVLKGVQADMVAKYGTNGESILGGPSGAAVTGYATQEEAVAAVKDKRYGRDRKYTNEVRAKVARSKIFG